jgi:hypothetical protein
MDEDDSARTQEEKEVPDRPTFGARSRTVGRWNKVRQWVLLDGDRMVVAGGLLAGLLVAYTTLELIGFTAVQEFNALSTAFGALVSGNVTLITVVLSINQLVLSRALGGVSGIEDNIEGVSDYRERVRQETGQEVTPEEPAAFLEMLLRSTREEATRVQRIMLDTDDHDLQEDVENLTGRLTDHTDHVIRLLDRPDTGVFGALASTLSTNYAQELNAVRRIQVRYESQLSEEGIEALENITRRIKDVDIARQYFKTMYIQEELSYFSRVLLYVGVPAQFITVAALIAMSKSGSSLSGLPVTLPLLAPVIVTVAFTPLAMLFSFVIRVATVAQNTISPAQFTTPEDES